MNSKYKFEEALLIEGKKILPDFFIPEHQVKFYEQLPELFSAKRGIIIVGEYGCGKTLCMKVCRQVFRYGRFISTRHIMREFQIIGEEIIENYGRFSFVKGEHNNLLRDKPINYCFDDLGINDSVKNRYGNTSNVMAEIILDRYDGFLDYGMKSYFTTNKTADQIEELYGDRVRDRLKEMCNLIVMPGNSLRK